MLTQGGVCLTPASVRTAAKCPLSKRSLKTPADQSLILQNQRSAHLIVLILSLCLMPLSLLNSTSTPSLQPHGLTTVPSMTSAEPLLPVFWSQIPSSVRSSHLVSRRSCQWADASSGGVQGAHRPTYHDSEWRNGQSTSALVFFRGSTIKGCGRRSMGWYVLGACSYSIISVCWLNLLL